MENSSETRKEEETQSTSATSQCCPVCGKIDFKFILSRAQQILLNPKSCWTQIKSEELSVREIYIRYLLVLYAIAPVCMLIKSSIIGYSIPIIGKTYRTPFFGTLFHQILFYLVGLALIYVSAIIVEKLAPKFEGQTDTTNAFRLVAYSLTPACLVSFFVLFGALGSIIALLGGIYSLYVFFQGISPMTGVPEPRRPAFFIVLALVVILVNLVIFAIVSMIARPAMPSFNFPESIDIEKLQKSIERMVPTGN